nr:MAG TPA: hypothetical protein [Caudoviricetes sp.]
MLCSSSSSRQRPTTSRCSASSGKLEVRCPMPWPQ